MIIQMVRDLELPGEGILGRMLIGETYLQTIERNWVGNKKGISCIPPGDYTVYLQHSPRFGADTPSLYSPKNDVYLDEDDIPAEKRGKARSEIKIHAANIASQLQGCIAVGRRRGKLYSNDLKRQVIAIHDSRVAVSMLRAFLSERRPGGGNLLRITENFSRE